MTVSYATERSRFTSIKFVHSSRSNTILILRVLSEAAGVLLGTTIYSTFEVVQWVKISRPDGLPFPEFLALQPSTGPLGLLVLALGRGLPAAEWPMKPRVMSFIRLVSEFAVPVLGVLIMSNVSIDPVYLPIKDTVKPFAFGMEPFNASVASQLGIMEDLLFNINYVSFLYNTIRAIDITPNFENRVGCESGLSITTKSSCARHVLLAQELQNVDAQLPLNLNSESDVVLSAGQQIYSLEFHDNIVIKNESLTCETINSGPAYYRLCTQNAGDGSIHANIIPCPPDLVNAAQCNRTTTWQSNPGFSTSIQASFQNATISYNRPDGRILSHELETDAQSVPLEASELLSAMTVLLNTTAVGNAGLASPILGSPSHFFGRLIAGHMYRIGKLTSTNPSARIKGTNALQSILAMTLFYCQNGILGQAVLPFAGRNTSSDGSTGAFGEQQRTSLASLAETRYRIEVGRAALWAYVAIGGLTLALCFLALIIGSICEWVKRDAQPTLYPALDFWTQCRVETEDGALVPVQKRGELTWIQGQELFREVQGLKVTRRKQKLREGVELG
ncbi:hypothetical protein K469DRAFT_744275 [Zopfia rhizophila CBS 207.26]|uniref:Uncharacterized protein n=1 Tax=Zopfia rhizophila CBS 207.26 TaxID=1314779 RepID=A0A6A6EX58_9PEZI|nr:hypothetical protein K469DRAFT_744275 [Zopfia rhizophila CBS 207.26]